MDLASRALMKRPHFGFFSRIVRVTLALALLAAAPACYGTVGFHASSQAPTQLVEISPGVWVVYDYSEPVFYSGESYWWYRSGRWYRSSYVDSGWVAVRPQYVPLHLQRMERPQRYVRYRQQGLAVRAVPREHMHRRYQASSPRGRRDDYRGRDGRDYRDDRDWRDNDRGRDPRASSGVSDRRDRYAPAPTRRDERRRHRRDRR
jgi:hypothetical protein